MTEGVDEGWVSCGRYIKHYLTQHGTLCGQQKDLAYRPMRHHDYGEPKCKTCERLLAARKGS